MNVTFGESESEGGTSFESEHDRREQLHELRQRMQERVRVIAARTQAWVTQNPFAALGIAVAAGFLAGRAMRAWALR